MTPPSAENAAVFRNFPRWKLTGPRGEDCYTFERVATRGHEIRSDYYPYYKKKRRRMKEETTWS
jgi:hypothetical protein